MALAVVRGGKPVHRGELPLAPMISAETELPGLCAAIVAAAQRGFFTG